MATQALKGTGNRAWQGGKLCSERTCCREVYKLIRAEEHMEFGDTGCALTASGAGAQEELVVTWQFKGGSSLLTLIQPPPLPLPDSGSLHVP